MKCKGNVLEHIFYEVKQRSRGDVLLLCEGEKVWFHRLLLAAASPFLKVLMKDVDEETIISLSGYTKADVLALSRFMYGETEKISVRVQQFCVDLGMPCFPHNSTVHEVEEMRDNGLCSDIEQELNCETKTVSLINHISSCHAETAEMCRKIHCDFHNKRISQFSEETVHEIPQRKVKLVQMGKGKARCLYCSHCTKKMSSHVFTHHPEHFLEYKQVAGRRKSAWPQKCEFCDKMLINRTKMLRHLESHERRNETGVGQCLVCDVCAKAFDTQIAFSAHMKFHSKEVKCEIENCATRFQTKYLMREHMLCVHKREALLTSNKRNGEERGMFLCTDSGKHLTTKLGLLGHQKIFHTDRLIQCKICNETFASDVTLKKHTARHSEPNFECVDCQLKFYMKSDLHKHIRTKHIKGRFSCDVCFKSFLTKGNLNDHSNTHTGLKPYKCSHCEKSYQNSSNLSAHKKSCHPNGPN